nr:hypothetical protein [Tanacetum cinerariifolium]
IQTNIADLSKHTTRYISPVLTQKVFANIRRVGKGFSGVETPLFEKEVAPDVVPPTPTSPSPSSPVILSSPPHQPPCPPQDAEGSSLLFQQALDTCSALALRVEGLENDKGRKIVDMDQDEGIELVADQEKDAEVEGRRADKQAEIYNIYLDHSSKVTAASTHIPAAKPKTLTITVAPAVSTRMRKGVVIRDPKEELPSDTPAETPKLWSSVRVTSLGVISLPNDEIFTGLAQMGYEKPSTKLTFYKAFFSTQWKFIQLIIQSNIADLSKHTNRYISPVLTQKVFANMRRVGKGFSRVETPLFKTMLAVRDVADEAEAQIPAQDDDVQEHVTEEITNEVVPPTPTSPSPSSPIIPSLPLHQSPSPPQSQAAEGSSHVFQQVLDTCSALVLRVEGLENANAAQQLEIVKLKARVKKLERLNEGRISVDMETDERIELVVDQEKDVEIEGRQADKQAEIYNIDLDHSSRVLSMQEDDTKVHEAVEVVTTAKLITEVVTAAATQVVSASTPISTAKPKLLKIVAAPTVSTRKRKGVVIKDPNEELHIDTLAETPIVKDKGKGILIEDPKPMKKKDQIEMDVEYAKKLQEELDKEQEEAYKQTDWNAALDHVQAKEPQYIKRYHGIKMKPQSEFEARKNMIFYLKNTKGYKMEFFKGKTYDQIIPIFQARFDANLKFLFKSREETEKKDEEIIKSINETSVQKAAKRRKLS